MYPILFEGDFFSIYSYGLALSLAVFFGTLLLAREAKFQGIKVEPLLDMVLLVIAGGVIGARLFYVFFYEPQYFINYPLEIFKFWQGGLVFYGGLIGGVLVGWGYLRLRGISFWPTADLVAPFLAFGYGMVRIGCFFNGCCYGEPTAMVWGVQFPVIDNVFRHPTQLYLSLISFGIFLALYYMLRHKKFQGQVILAYLILYSIGRTAVEFFRENLVIIPPITIAQLVSMILFLLGVFFYLKLSRQAIIKE